MPIKPELKVPVDEKVEVPVTAKVELSEVAPVTPKVPAIVTLPPKLPVPVPVENVPVPACEKLPKVWEILLAKLEVELAARVPFKVVAPVTAKVPPKEVAPELTVKVFEPVTVVSPLSEIAPEPVENVPVPDWEILPKV